MDALHAPAGILRWRLDNTGVRVEFHLSPADAEACSTAIIAISDADEATPIAESRYASLHGVLRGRHSLRLRVGPRVYRVAVRLAAGVRWESAVAAASRGEGLIASKRAGRDDVSVTRVSPVDAQAVIAQCVRRGLTSGVRTSATTPRDVYEVAERDLRAYEAATQALLMQRERVRAGGELWTRSEQLAKLTRLGALVDVVRRKRESDVPLDDADKMLLAAYESGRAAIHGDAELGEAPAGRTPDEMMAAIMRLRAGHASGEVVGGAAAATEQSGDAKGSQAGADSTVWAAELAGALRDVAEYSDRVHALLESRHAHAHDHASGHGHASGHADGAQSSEGAASDRSNAAHPHE